MEAIRILQVFASLDRGGAESMIMNVYRNIDRTRVQFDFIVNEQKTEYAFEDEIRDLGGRVFRIPRFHLINYYIYKNFWKTLLVNHPEWRIIHGHHSSPAFIYLKVAKTLNRTTIVHSHIAGKETFLKGNIKRALRFPLRYIADYLFSCSNIAGNWLYGGKKCKNKNYILFKNAIATKDFIFNYKKRVEKRKEIHVDGKFVIGHVGRFQMQKNHYFCIEVFNEVHKQCDKAVLLLVGDGKLRSVIEQKVNDLGLSESVIFTGIRSDIPELLMAMDVFLFPSLFEGLPVTLIEAQASGLKILASDTISTEVKVTDLVEFISLKQTESYWAEKVLQYVEGYERKNTYNEISKAGYDINNTTKWLEAFYLDLYNEPRL